MFLCGVALTIGPQATVKFFLRKKNLKVRFLSGVCQSGACDFDKSLDSMMGDTMIILSASRAPYSSWPVWGLWSGDGQFSEWLWRHMGSGCSSPDLYQRRCHS